MCGIVGVFSQYERNDFHTIVDMMNTLIHRGPDDSGVRAFNFNTLSNEEIRYPNNSETFHGFWGFRRLSIQDLTSCGHQPMVDEKKRIVLCFNGEIYNASELRVELMKKGYKFNGNSDTEVILNAYIEYGFEKMLLKLNGMFAIAIADLVLKKIFLVRDRVGIKPLYYTFLDGGETVAFSSEIKAFIKIKQFNREINIEALEESFVFGESLYNPLLKKIEEVKPGEFIVFHFGKKELYKQKYFNWEDFQRSQYNPKLVKHNQEKLEEILKKAVKRQLVSDVKVGCQLSGGVDSSLMLWYAKDSIKDTVSIIVPKEAYSEENYIDYITSKMPEISVHKYEFNEKDFMDNIKKAVWHYESMISYHNIVALLKLTEQARKEVTVLLSGEGADELFGGYTWFEDGYYISKYLEQLSKGGKRDFKLEERYRAPKGIRNFSEFAIKTADSIPYMEASNLIGEFEYKKYWNNRLDFFEQFTGNDFEKQIKYELSTRLPGLLMRQDKTSMANSIENRVPILDNEVIECVMKLPKEELLHNENDQVVGKYILKKICAEKFGKSFAFRRKMGFPLPFHEYLKSDKFKEYFYDELVPSIRTRGIFNYEYIIKRFEEIEITNNRWEYAGLWKAITTEIWCQMFLNNKY